DRPMEGAHHIHVELARAVELRGYESPRARTDVAGHAVDAGVRPYGVGDELRRHRDVADGAAELVRLGVVHGAGTCERSDREVDEREHAGDSEDPPGRRLAEIDDRPRPRRVARAAPAAFAPDAQRDESQAEQKDGRNEDVPEQSRVGTEEQTERLEGD